MDRFYLGAFAVDIIQLGSGWQIASRFTWEGIQSSMGLVAANYANIFGNVDEVDHYAGATTISLHSEMELLLCSYIMGGPTLRAFMMVIGHTLKINMV